MQPRLLSTLSGMLGTLLLLLACTPPVNAPESVPFSGHLNDRPFLGPNGELMVRIPPCLTPTVPVDYRDLLPPGHLSCSTERCLQGHPVPGEPLPTPYPGQPPFVDPSRVTIGYNASGAVGECSATPTPIR